MKKSKGAVDDLTGARLFGLERSQRCHCLSVPFQRPTAPT
jgi:hypothetical protein